MEAGDQDRSARSYDARTRKESAAECTDHLGARFKSILI